MCRLVSKIFIWLTETYVITKVGPAHISEEGILSNRGNLRITSDVGKVLVLARTLLPNPWNHTWKKTLACRETPGRVAATLSLGFLPRPLYLLPSLTRCTPYLSLLLSVTSVPLPLFSTTSNFSFPPPLFHFIFLIPFIWGYPSLLDLSTHFLVSGFVDTE